MNTLCFIDLDGVLVDFVEGAFKHHHINIPWPDIKWDFVKQAGIHPEDFWNPLGLSFWANLQPTAEFPAIIAAAERKFGPENIFICSSPCKTSGCTAGKAMWVESHLPDYSGRLILTGRKSVFSGPNRVLIDDRMENIYDWVGAGGIGLLVPRPWNTSLNISRDVSHTVVKTIESFVV